MPNISELPNKKPRNSDYILIGNGSLSIHNLKKLFSFDPEFQIVHLAREEKIINKEPFFYIKLDGTNYRNTEYDKIHNYFNGDIPNLTDKPYMLKLNNDMVNIKENNTYKNHKHNFNIDHSNSGFSETFPLDRSIIAGSSYGNTVVNDYHNPYKEKISFNLNISSIDYQGANYVIPDSKIVNYYCKMKMD